MTMRLALSTIDKRINKLEKRARLLHMPPLVVTCTADWSDADRLAYASATDDERCDIEDRYLGAIPNHPNPLGIKAIVVVAPLSPPADDDADDLPSTMTAAEYEAAMQRREQVIQENEELERREAHAGVPDERSDPLDPSPEGDPNEVIYQHPQFGPVRRVEHQLRRQRAREEAQRIAERRKLIDATQTGYTAYHRSER